MQKTALYARVGDLNEKVRTLELRCQALTVERNEAIERLRLARSGLLIALPHVDPDPVRLLVGAALDLSEIRGKW